MIILSEEIYSPKNIIISNKIIINKYIRNLKDENNRNKTISNSKLKENQNTLYNNIIIILKWKIIII